MRESVIASELDLALVHALQLRPRASWAELAQPVGAGPGTLARRWERLSGDGLAWVYAAPGREFPRTRCTAFVRVRCRPGARQRLAALLSECTEVATVELTASRDAGLLLDVLTPGLPALTRFVTGRLEAMPGVTDVDCLVATSLSVEGSRWRLRSLGPAQLAELGRPGSGQRAPGAAVALDALDHALLDALVCDGRLGFAALAARTGASAATVRRRVSRLTGTGVITFRCDMADGLAGAPVPVTFLGRAPARDVSGIHRTLAALPECRVVAAVSGPDNILATLWLPDLGDVQRRETALGARLPSLTVTDRIVGLRTVKRMGHLLDADGRRTGVRPIRPW
ncbi:Lrp/AsnC family transcriptional regulator [Streptomyces sp. NPDC059740]|uniref:Lrp/AsnC family transcriptional regulator n=1 Tax=Streptomyces sp. NPDC059740 TaxID=3346926 RepID=UPI00365323CA